MASSRTPPNPKSALVVGAGIVGLMTARELSGRGWSVLVLTRDDPLATTSAMAGAIWYPFLAEPRDRVLAWSAISYRRLAALACSVSGRDGAAGVRMREVVEVFAEASPDLWWREAVPTVQWLPAEDLPSGAASAVRVTVPVFDVPRHLSWLLSELARLGVDVVRGEVTSLDDALLDGFLAVVNCTGLGARELCGDDELRAVRGQVLRYSGIELPNAWIDDRRTRPCYLIPRDHDLVAGGSADLGDERLAEDANDSLEIRRAATDAFPQLAGRDPIAVQVGLRPYRSSVRLEAERGAGGQLLAHCYGHGGSGYTVAWACAEEVVDRLEQAVGG
ncbi:MAG: FAD-dependent oxidoreductase [Planctomycetota bacterium]